mmetsp:Transcript_21704/g.65053  ORF Transcript_21704/g.65053 Transcript_21704/m.65053 type:complete len:119 (-) Transcript_21704:57-413(-)|eukprot:CAMPEP_0119272804 /NCGR_PEP_ID=MMETSP1329-20130426/9091_1 /TAXON_ID=114041 /ORGANISM="Genus nov. species nov., Strain RCC1024" /LENGTH=118 /DNA_ID=CAMNT_0007272913 /DNA_START=219 /DNA_END=575 /DNA_ORIENTATION=-
MFGRLSRSLRLSNQFISLARTQARSNASAAAEVPPLPVEKLEKRNALQWDCTRLIDTLEDLDEMTAREMKLVYEQEKDSLVELDTHIQRLRALRHVLSRRLKEAEEEHVEGVVWPGAC